MEKPGIARLSLDPLRTQALLIGVSEYERLAKIPPARGNIEDFAALLKDPAVLGLPDNHVKLLPDKRRDEILDAIDDFIEDHHNLDTQTLLLYYAGHGLRESAGSRELFLSGTNTRADRLDNSGVPFEKIKKKLEGSHLQSRIFILDACYSGLATMGGDPDAQLEADLEIKGTYVLSSASEDQKAFFDTAARNTFFTGDLLRLVREGLSRPQPLLSLEDIFEELRKQAQHSQPKRRNNLSERDFYLFRNRWLEPDRYWEELLQAPDVEKYEQYLAYFPEGHHREEVLWQRAGLLATAAGYAEYLAAWPEGQFAEEAKEQQLWLTISANDTVDGWLSYVRRYRHAEADDKRLYARVTEAFDRITSLVKTGLGTAERAKLRARIGELEDLLAQEKSARAEVQEQLDAASLEAQSLAAKLKDFSQALEDKETEIEIVQHQRKQDLAQAEAEKKEAFSQLTVLTQERDKLQASLEKARLSGSEAYLRAAEQAWNDQFAQATSKAELDRFLAWFPSGPFAEKAKAQQEMLTRLKVPEMVLIKGGTFEMGDVMGDNENSDEKPVHKVTVSDFYLGKYAVTFDEYDAYCEATHKEKPDDKGWGRADRPVINVSWEDAQEYCQWLRDKTGLVWRLPTEAEWEYAARGVNGKGGAKVRFGNGKDIADPSQMNFDASEKYKKPYSVVGEYRQQTVPVGSFAPNGLGLYDMSGNVWEWCWDWYGEKYYASSPADNPQGPADGAYRVRRGGSWSSDPAYARVSDRLYWLPGFRLHFLGFRLARSI